MAIKRKSDNQYFPESSVQDGVSAVFSCTCSLVIKINSIFILRLSIFFSCYATNKRIKIITKIKDILSSPLYTSACKQEIRGESL